MRVICAWCGHQEKDKYPLTDTRVSHTMCNECFKIQSTKMTKEEYYEEHESREELAGIELYPDIEENDEPVNKGGKL